MVCLFDNLHQGISHADDITIIENGYFAIGYGFVVDKDGVVGLIGLDAYYEVIFFLLNNEHGVFAADRHIGHPLDLCRTVTALAPHTLASGYQLDGDARTAVGHLQEHILRSHQCFRTAGTGIIYLGLFS